MATGWEVVSHAPAAPDASASQTPTGDNGWSVVSSAPAPSQSLEGAVQAGSSGFNAGVADIAGIPMDTATNAVNLLKSGGELAYLATGNLPPTWMDPSKPENVPGTSAWIKNHVRAAGGSNLIDTGEDTTLNKYMHAGGEASAAALTGGAESAPAAARAMAGGALGGMAQQGVAGAGGGPVAQMAAGLVGGAAANRVLTPKAAPTSVKAAPSPAAPESGAYTAEDMLKPVAEPTPEAAPPQGAANAAKGGKAAQATDIEFTSPVDEGFKSESASPAEQKTRMETLKAIGLQETRKSAVTGSYKDSGTDFQTSRLTNEAGDRMTQVMDNERAAQRDYAENLIQQSGGTAGLDSSARYARGQTLSRPIELYDTALRLATKGHYAVADQRAAGAPIELKSTQDYLNGNQSSFMGTVEGAQLYRGVQTRLNELGLTQRLTPQQYVPEGLPSLGAGPSLPERQVQVPGTGNLVFNPATVAQAERLKQYLNDNWTPRTARLIKALHNVVDEDVMRTAGEDIYADSRAVRTLRDRVLETPEATSNILIPRSDRPIAYQSENLANTLTSLPIDQFKEYIAAVQQAGRDPGIAQSAADAMNELRGHFANNVKAAGDSTAGMWNQKQVNQYLQTNKTRMAMVFSPEEMQQFKTLNDAGNYLRMDRSYPGAAAQGHNLVVHGVMKAVEHGGAAGGALLGHIPGAVVGFGASKAAEKLDEFATKRAVENKRIVKLQ